MRKYYWLLITMFCMEGCKKFVDIEGSPVQVETEKVFTDEQTATAAMLGLYNQGMIGSLGFFTGGHTLYGGLSADELFITGTNVNAEQFFNNAIPTENSIIQNAFWSTPYRFIYHLNAILDGLQKSTQLSELFKSGLDAEARCVRALCYFYMVNYYGGVPLILSTDYQSSMVMPRTSIDVVYQAMEDDLKFAKLNLATEYISTGRARPNSYTASALLARVYLYQKKWAEAEAEATRVIGSGIYPLLTDLNQVFLIGSSESIWCIAKDNNNTAEGGSFIPSSTTAKPPYAFTDTLLKSYEVGDKRKINWMKANIVSGVSFFYPFKYKARAATPMTEMVIVLRSAEQYLIRAEARLELGNIDSARADLNRIRIRAGLPILTTTDPMTIRKAIEKERLTELFGEWGHRWLDLKRTNRAIAHLPGLKPFFQPTSQLFPIPYNELQKNPFLVQNPGY